MGNEKLLVMIDDDMDDREIFKMAIEDLDVPINCLYFTDCESAVAHFSQYNAAPPTFVFIDLKLPRLDGDQCLRQLQQLRQFDDPFMVVYSSSVPDELRWKLSNSGVDKVIQKTPSITELTSQIRQVVNMK